MSSIPFEVSPHVRDIHRQVTSMPEVARAMEFIANDNKNLMDIQLKLASIPAPTFHERAKGEAFAEYFRKLGLVDIHFDEFGNILGTRKGSGNGPRILIDAHLDTAFTMDTPLIPRYEGNRIYLPGLGDDTAGLCCQLGVIRALNDAGVQTEGDLVFIGTVEEESPGCLGGMKKHMSIERYDAGMCIDGTFTGKIVYRGTAIRTMALHFHGPGGHVAAAFENVPNPVYAATDTIARITNIAVPPDTETFYCVTGFHAGDDRSIAQDSTIVINYRSSSQKYLEDIHEKILQAAAEAAEEESNRLKGKPITWDYELLTDMPAADQNRQTPLIEAVYAAFEGVGVEPDFTMSGSTNCTMGILAGMPSICISSGGDGGDVHTVNEWYEDIDRHLCIQTVMVTALMMCGIAMKSKPLAGQ